MSCILIRCTNDKNLEMIEQLVEELYYSTFGVFGFGPLVSGIPSQESDWTEICEICDCEVR
jgi:hypothetical protein